MIQHRKTSHCIQHFLYVKRGSSSRPLILGKRYETHLLYCDRGIKLCTLLIKKSKILQSAKEVLSGNRLLRSDAFINGAWINCKKSFPVHCPHTNEFVYEVSDAGRDEASAAIHAAEAAFESWRQASGKDRSLLINGFCRNIMASKEALASIIVAESGKIIREAEAEVDIGTSFLQWFAEEAKRISGDTMAGANNQSRRFVFREPVGVVGLISPWNHPLAMVTRKLGAAMAAGCTSVIKPSEETPLTALALAAIAEETGIPAGVLNILPCSREMTPTIGDHLCESSAVRKISFTGSTTTGKLLLKKSANTVKRLSLELGGNAPFIVFNSADIRNVIDNALQAKFRGNGQTCIASNRFLIQNDIHDSFVDEMKKAVAKLQIGDPFCKKTDIGPLINSAGIEKVESHVMDAIKKGAQPVIGCEKHPIGQNFFKPSILVNCNKNMRCMNEETFGPLISVMKFQTEKEVIDLANSTPYGLAAYVFSQDIAQVFRVSDKLQFGMLGVNESRIPSEIIPFGGVKESGFGIEGSKYGIKEYLNIKYVCLGGL